MEWPDMLESLVRNCLTTERLTLDCKISNIINALRQNGGYRLRMWNWAFVLQGIPALSPDRGLP